MPNALDDLSEHLKKSLNTQETPKISIYDVYSFLCNTKFGSELQQHQS